MPENIDTREVVRSFQNMRKHGELCDYEIISSDGKAFKVHKSYIVATSDYFSVMLNGNCGMVESQSNTVTLHNVNSAGLAPVLDHMYGVDVYKHIFHYMPGDEVDIDTMIEIMNAASVLQVQSLLNGCAYILYDVSVINTDHEFLDIWTVLNKFSLTNNHEDLERRLAWIFMQNFLKPDEDESLVEDFCKTIDEVSFLRILKIKNPEGIDIEGCRKRFECLCKYYITNSEIATPSKEMYDHAFFTYCFLLNEDEKYRIASTPEYSVLPWFQTIQKECSIFLQLPMHQQVLETCSKYSVKNGFESTVVAFGLHEEYNDKLSGIQTVIYDDELLYGMDFEDIKLGVHGWKQRWDRNSDKQMNGSGIFDIPDSPEFDPRDVQCVEVNNYMFICDYHGNCYLFNPRNITFEKLSSLPVLHCKYTLVSVGLNVFTIGGEFYGTSTDCVKKFDFMNNKWDYYLQLPTKVDSLVSCVHQGLIYVGGGSCRKDGFEKKSYAFICIDPENQTVKKLHDLPQENDQWFSPMLAVYKDNIYIRSSYDNSTSVYDSAPVSGDVYLYNDNPSSWTKLSKTERNVWEFNYSHHVLTKGDSLFLADGNGVRYIDLTDEDGCQEYSLSRYNEKRRKRIQDFRYQDRDIVISGRSFFHTSPEFDKTIFSMRSSKSTFCMLTFPMFHGTHLSMKFTPSQWD